MGLLDGVLGSVISGAMGGGAAKPDLMSGLIGGLLQQAGGVGGLLNMMKGAGMGQHADSWQGTGQNMPQHRAQRVVAHLATCWRKRASATINWAACCRKRCHTLSTA
jgi:uncharacterized protein YidB (DUF937 family)